MCIRPLLIDNVNYGKFKNTPFEKVKDTLNRKIYVSCGHCPSCIALKQSYFIQRFQMESLSNDLWTGMLSYAPQALPVVQIGKYKHRYADTRDVQLLIKRLRNIDAFGMPFKYWFISERGGERHRPHWHFIISTPKIQNETLSERLSREQQYWKVVLDNWYTNKGSRRTPIKCPNLHYVCRNGRYNYDFHYCNPSLTDNGNTDVAFYVSKYLLKDDKFTQNLRSALRLNLPDDSFSYYWNLLRHKSLVSQHLGDIVDPLVSQYIQDCINFSINSKSSMPLFFNPETGQSFPLAPYYRKYLTLDQALAFAENSDTHPSERIIEISMDDVKRKNTIFAKVVDRINARDLAYDMLSSINEYGKFENDFNEIDFLSEIPSSRFTDNSDLVGFGNPDFDDV